jgi:methyltransferase-like protein
VTKAAIVHLAEISPRSVYFEDLYAESCRKLEQAAFHVDVSHPNMTRQALAADLMTMFSGGVIQATLRSPSFESKVLERPVASPLARVQAASSFKVTNRRHELVKLEGFSRFILRRLDGRHDRPLLTKSLQRSIRNGNLPPPEGHSGIGDKPESVARVLDTALNLLAKHALLVA